MSETKYFTPALYLVRGVAGSGKSTYCKNILIPKLKEETGLTDIPFFEADDFFMKPQTDGSVKYEFDQSQLHFAHRQCLNRMKQAFDGADFMNVVVVANTFTTVKEMKPYIDFAQQNGIEVNVIRMNSYFGSVHNVPQETLKRMRERLASNHYPGEIVVR